MAIHNFNSLPDEEKVKQKLFCNEIDIKIKIKNRYCIERIIQVGVQIKSFIEFFKTQGDKIFAIKTFCEEDQRFKPENLVLILRDTQDQQIHQDVARIWRSDNLQARSGTPGQMAPEVFCRQNNEITIDYFALGVMVYEFILARRPHVGKSRQEIKQLGFLFHGLQKLKILLFKYRIIIKFQIIKENLLKDWDLIILMLFIHSLKVQNGGNYLKNNYNLNIFPLILIIQEFLLKLLNKTLTKIM